MACAQSDSRYRKQHQCHAHSTNLGQRKSNSAIRRRCLCLLSASLRTNRMFRFTMQQSHNLRFNNINNCSNTNKFNIINNKSKTIFVRLKL